MSECPICKTTCPVKESRTNDETIVECKRCGTFVITSSALSTLPGIADRDPDGTLKVSFALRKITENKPKYGVTTDTLALLLSSTVLPTPPEQLDNLIYFLGEESSEAGQAFQLGKDDISRIGARSLGNLGFMVESAISLGLVAGNCIHLVGGTYSLQNLKLTIEGWTTYLDLKKGKVESRQAFMAMKFGNSELDSIYLNHFKPAVGHSGFELKRLDEGQQAGLIDDQLRVQIRKSMFLIADLTHHNNGAYWEAGYAEGLGKPVIYTCRKDVFDDKANTTHFDTNHHLTVVWEEGKIEEAVKKLKATIRATLPEDAKMEDNAIRE